MINIKNLTALRQKLVKACIDLLIKALFKAQKQPLKVVLQLLLLFIFLLKGAYCTIKDLFNYSVKNPVYFIAAFSIAVIVILINSYKIKRQFKAVSKK